MYSESSVSRCDLSSEPGNAEVEGADGRSRRREGKKDTDHCRSRRTACPLGFYFLRRFFFDALLRTFDGLRNPGLAAKSVPRDSGRLPPSVGAMIFDLPRDLLVASSVAASSVVSLISSLDIAVS